MTIPPLDPLEHLSGTSPWVHIGCEPFKTGDWEFRVVFDGSWQAMTCIKVGPSQTSIPGLSLDRRKEERRHGLGEPDPTGLLYVVVCR